MHPDLKFNYVSIHIRHNAEMMQKVCFNLSFNSTLNTVDDEFLKLKKYH